VSRASIDAACAVLTFDVPPKHSSPAQAGLFYVRTRLRQGASRYSQKGLVSSRLARERQLLHPLSVRSWEHPGNAGIFKPLRSRPERRADHARRMMTAQAIPQFWLQRTNVWRRV